MISQYLNNFRALSPAESRLFDFFRGLSATIVLVAHAYQILVAPQVSSPAFNKVIFHIAGCAVMVFFFLSGFMIFSSLYRNASNNNFNEIHLKTFFVDRLIRLYPPLIFSFLIMITVYLVAKYFNIDYLAGHEFYILRDEFILDSGVFGSLIFVQNMLNDYIGTPSLNASLWSLSHEFWFYVIGALLFKVTLSPQRIKFLIPLLIISTIMILYGRAIPFFFGLMLWLVGGIIFIAYQNIKIKPSISYLLASVVLLFSSFFLFTSSNNTLYFLSKYVFGFSFTVFIIYLLSLESNLIETLTKNSAFNYFADSARYSYTSYVIHWPIYMLIYGVLGSLLASNYFINFAVFATSIALIVTLASKTASTLENKKRLISLFERAGYVYEK